MNQRREEREGKTTLEHRYEADQPAEQPGNPSGASEGSCDLREHAHAEGEPLDECDVGITAHVDDWGMEESKPGGGIPGFEAEEEGGS